MNVLLERGADRTVRKGLGLTPLMMQAFLGHISCVARMLEDPEARATIDMQDDGGLTALRLACSQNDSAFSLIIVQLLLEGGADPSLANDH